MKTPEIISQPANDFKTEIISVYPEHVNDITKILRDQCIGYKQIGEDQSKRLLLQITYHEAQIKTIDFIKKGIRELERGALLADVIIMGIKRLIS